MASHGADVVVADLRETPRTGDATPTLEAVADETDARGTYIEWDVTEYDDVETAVEHADGFGGVDVMVNNAGIPRRSSSWNRPRRTTTRSPTST